MKNGGCGLLNEQTRRQEMDRRNKERIKKHKKQMNKHKERKWINVTKKE